jgi:hypothetical protein
MSCFSKLILFLVFIPFLFGVKRDFRTVRELEGFESTHYSDDTGLPYLSILYKAASVEKPKVGFLKFGISFLKINYLKIRLDLRHAPSSQLLLMWKDLITQKAIRYVTAEPIHLAFVDKDGKLFNINASKGKFTSSGELHLWGKVLCSTKKTVEEFKSVSVFQDDNLKALVVKKGTDEENPLILNFKNH